MAAQLNDPWMQSADVSGCMSHTCVQASQEMLHQRRYGTDKPDLRFGLEMTDVTNIVSSCGFKVFSSAAAAGGIIKALCVPEVCNAAQELLPIQAWMMTCT
jgi:aspartyl-tRNA synthetase